MVQALLYSGKEWLLVLLPAAKLLEELRMDVLECLWLCEDLLFKPLNRCSLIDYEQLELQNLPDGHAPLVVLSHLLRKVKHTITFRKPLSETGVNSDADSGTVTPLCT